jgi:regulator of sirC expression with transglutaminase-like and TPR domain
MPQADLTLFSHVASREESELDLSQAAFLIAEAEYPELDIPHYVELLDRLGERARACLADADRASEPPLRSITRLLYEDVGFSGNDRAYYDPRNSFLNDVIDRRTGIPITLALVILEVARRAEVSASGVGFPGHFLVRTEYRSGAWFIDPWNGTVCDRQRLRVLYGRATGEVRDPEPRLLEPLTKRLFLVRMLNNLRGIYTANADNERLRSVLERIQILAPSDEVARQLHDLLPRPARPPRIFN